MNEKRRTEVMRLMVKHEFPADSMSEIRTADGLVFLKW